eukprot:TRINITY_DN60_c0_g1_i1.p1 TRINITY_DN60_c0_g1~~TRINITY_DN60_c0_g1_i1.p1  ORF type:complete len:205 (-),score=81.37 TRINITY_DN60_c0_g1_i1:68-682(-)
MANNNNNNQELFNRLKNTLTIVPDFPKEGINFYDISPLCADIQLMRDCIQDMVDQLQSKGTPVDAVVGVDARGFIFGPLLSDKLSIPFVMARKKLKLPGEKVTVEYGLEYNDKSVLQMQKNALPANSNVVIVDDLLATGGSILAAVELVEMIDCKCSAVAFPIELANVKSKIKVDGKEVEMTARERIAKHNADIQVVVNFIADE